MNQKIEAIKAIRALTQTLGLDAGLKESKDFVDSLWANKRDKATQEIKAQIKSYAEIAISAEYGRDLISHIETMFYIKTDRNQYAVDELVSDLFRYLMTERYQDRDQIRYMVNTILDRNNI